MATNGNQGNQSKGSNQESNSQDNTPAEAKLERISRLNIGDKLIFESTFSSDQGTVKMSLEDQGDKEISSDDINNIVQFFSSFQREKDRMQNQGAGNGGNNSGTNNRGTVRHPETDGRLKGNEQFRPNDPDRSQQAAGGAKGGSRSNAN